MTAIHSIGEAMVLAQQGQRQLADLLVAALMRLFKASPAQPQPSHPAHGGR